MPLSSFWSNPDVRNHAEQAADYAVGRFRERVLENCEITLSDNPVGSPIEAIFCAWWYAHSAVEDIDGIWAFTLWAQLEVVCDAHTYRLDFRVDPHDVETLEKADALGWPVYRIGVELDGHEFHERTKEQVAYRNQRDRALTRNGWKLFHFSGSEVMGDPLKCVREVHEYAARTHHALWDRVYVYEGEQKAKRT